MPGGMERVLEAMARGSAARGHAVRVLVHAGRGEPVGEGLQNGVVVKRASYSAAIGTMPISLDYLRIYLDSLGWPDIVHLHEPFPPASLALSLMPAPCRLVVSWHSDIVRQWLLGPLAEWVQRRVLARADRIICSTARLRDSSVVLAPWHDKCAIVGFGLDVAAFRRAACDAAAIAAVRRRFGARFAMAVGRLVSYKGFDVLIRAVAATDIRLVIIGQGPMERALRQLSGGLGLDGRVVLAGGLSDTELAACYAAAEFLVLPSITRAETFGIVQLEAMAAAKPVVNTALPTGVPEVSRDGETGITVPPGDVAALAQALRRLWHDPALSTSLGRRALERVSACYSADVVARQLDELYRDVAALPGERSATSVSANPSIVRATMM